MEGKTFTDALKRFVPKPSLLPQADEDPVLAEHAERDRKRQHQMAEAILRKNKGIMFSGASKDSPKAKQNRRDANKRARAARKVNTSK